MPTILVPPIVGAIPVADFSSHNESDSSQIDWPTFTRYWLSLHPEAIVIIKVGQGDGWYINPYLHRQRWGAHAAGIRNVGLYWYVEVVCQGGPNVGKGLSGAQNADAFSKAQGDDGALVLREFYAGDWEDNVLATADLGAMAWDFGQRMALGPTLPGLRPLLYSAEWFANPHGLERDKRLANFLLWWASYQKVLPPIPEPWASAGNGIACWQFTDRAILPGVPFPTDVSWWLAGLPALRAIQWGYQVDPLGGQPIEPPPTVLVDDKGAARDVNGAALTISQGCTDLWRQLATVDPKRPDQAQAALQIKANADAVIKVTGLLSR